MEKKKKRASFTPVINVKAETGKKSEEKKSATKQVVEVVVEETRGDEKHEAAKVNILIPEGEAYEVQQEVHNKPEKEEEEEIEEELDTQEEIKEEEEEKESPKKSQQETVAELFGNNASSAMPEITVHKSSGTRGIIIWAVSMIALAVGVGGGLVLFTSGRGSDIKIPIGSSRSPSPTTAPEEKPTPSPTTAPVDKKKLKVQVINGGGVVGAGSKMKAFLEEKGYTVADVGNAASYTFEETEISVKESQKALLDMLESELGENYTVGKVDTSLSDASSYDIKVTVGKK